MALQLSLGCHPFIKLKKSKVLDIDRLVLGYRYKVQNAPKNPFGDWMQLVDVTPGVHKLCRSTEATL
jgi:hypothetical protein